MRGQTDPVNAVTLALTDRAAEVAGRIIPEDVMEGVNIWFNKVTEDVIVLVPRTVREEMVETKIIKAAIAMAPTHVSLVEEEVTCQGTVIKCVLSAMQSRLSSQSLDVEKVHDV